MLLPVEEDGGGIDLSTERSQQHLLGQTSKAGVRAYAHHAAPSRKAHSVYCSRLRPEAQVWQPMALPLFLVIREELTKMKNMIIPEGWGE